MQSAVLLSHVGRLSVRPFVTLVDCDHIGWKSRKIIARTNTFALCRPRPSTYSQANMGKFWGDWRWVGKSGVLLFALPFLTLEHRTIEVGLLKSSQGSGELQRYPWVHFFLNPIQSIITVSISTHIQSNPVFILSAKTSSNTFRNFISFHLSERCTGSGNQKQADS